MAITSEELSRLSHLARLELDAAEQADLLGQLNQFFTIVEQIRSVDTCGVIPLSHPIDVIAPLVLRLRADVACEPDDRTANQQNALAVENGLFLVPRVIE